MVESSQVLAIYTDIIDDVVNKVEDVFREEDVDVEILRKLKLLWKEKLKASKTAEYEDDKLHFQTVKNDTEAENNANNSEKSRANQESNYFLNKKYVPMHINMPMNAQLNTRTLIVYVPVNALKELNLQSLLTPSIIQATIGLPSPLATTILQQYIDNILKTNRRYNKFKPRDGILFKNQTDGNSDSSDSDDSSLSDDLSDLLKHELFSDEDDEVTEPSLNSEDDITDEDTPEILFDSDNIVVCQYYKIKRFKNKWKLCLKDGIMHLEGKDFLFQKASGDVDW